LTVQATRARLALIAGVGLPPLVFLGWMVFGSRTLGNDYVIYPAQGAQSLRFLTGEGLEPMWYPHLTGGVPIGGLFFAQYFHWPAWLASHAPGFWSGEALRWIGVRQLLLLAAAQIVLFAAFRRGARLSAGESYLLSLVCVYQLRNLDALRYGIGLDGTVYAQAVVLVAGLHVLAPSPVLLALIVFAAQLLFTCGYPVIIPFAGLVALVGLPVLARAVGVRAVLQRGLPALVAALFGFLLAAPNWVAVTEWLAVNQTRVRRPTLEWAGAWALRPQGLLDNLVFPWRAEVHSAFGGSTLLVLVLVAFVLALVRRVRVAWPLLLALAFPFVYALGRTTPVFPFCFEHVPGFSFLRVPGRSLAMLPILVSVGALWLRSSGAERAQGQESFLHWELGMAGRATLLLCLGGLAWLALGPPPALPEYCAAKLSDYWSSGRQALWLGLGAVAAAAALRSRTSRVAFAVLLLATAAQTGMLLRHGTWTTEAPRTATRDEFRRISHLPLYGEEPLLAVNEVGAESEGTATTAYETFVRTAKHRANCLLPILRGRGDKGVLLPFYLTDRVECVASRAAALSRLRSGPRCLREPAAPAALVVTPCPELAAAETATGQDLAELNQGNRIRALTTNLFTLDVDAPREAVLVTPLPEATRNWSGFVDGEPAPLLSVDGAFLGLRVPAGRHLVGVRYFSTRILLGYRIAFVAALALVEAALVKLALALARWRRARAGLAAGLVLAVTVAAVLAYRAWEKGFEARARREATLSHDYPDLLARQLARWSGSRPAATPAGGPRPAVRGHR
jgi:hypothetical protein